LAEDRWSKEQLDGFRKAAQSLKLYRRAELEEQEGNRPLIKELYVDPLPNDHVLKTVLSPNTTFLIGRKGTGKSTIFQRVQFELMSNTSIASAYVDIKTVWESASPDPDLLAKLTAETAMPPASLEKLLLYREFLKAVFQAIKEDLKNRLRLSSWARIKSVFSGTVNELFEGIDLLLERTYEDRFVSVVGVVNAEKTSTDELSRNNQTGVSVGGSAGPKPEVKVDLSSKSELKQARKEEAQYADVLLRAFDVRDFIRELKDLLNLAGFKSLYVFIDDFSELPSEAMEVVVNSLLAPLNNWSEELIKFKVAGYPGRIYYGKIDKTKMDEIYLDMFSLYGTTDVAGMEEKAIDFTRRLVESRLQFFCKSKPRDFVESDELSFWREVFYATMANPRNLGHLLFYVYESHILYGRRFGTRAVRVAAQKYYEDKIAPYFQMNKFLHETFEEKASVFSLRELLEALAKRAKELKRNRDSDVMRDFKGLPPTSHFHILLPLESLLATLELNFFLTKYYEMSNRDGRKVAVYALNYGLCQKYSIEFGRASEERRHRLYFVERIFDASALLQNFVKTNQEIRCDTCDAVIEFDKLDVLKHYDMRCFLCKNGTCKVVNLSQKYSEVISEVSSELLLPFTELGILQTLDSERRPMFAAEIASELDRSYQLVGKRGKILADRGLLNRNKYESGRRLFDITEIAKRTYFFDDTASRLDVSEDD
jgi:hypothetical protein